MKRRLMIWDRVEIWWVEHFVVTNKKWQLTYRPVEDWYALYQSTTS